MVAVTETSILLQTAPTTTGAKIGSGDWKLHVERLTADEDGGVWDLDVWDSDGTAGLVSLPGIAGNYLSTPDAAALDITGDLTIVVRALGVDWTFVDQTLVSKWGAAGQRSYRLILLSTGVLRFEWSIDGTASLTADSTSAVGLVDATWKWLAANIDVDNGAAGRSVRFWMSDDGATWTQLGTTVTTATATSIFNSTTPLEIGSTVGGTANLFVGFIDNVQLFAGIDAVTVNQAIPGGVLRFQLYDNDFTGSSPFTAVTGQSITLNTSGGTPAVMVAASGLTDTLWATLLWESLNDLVRGMEWSRGADQPQGRPRNGEIALTLLNTVDGENDPWVNYNNTRPGGILRAGITSATDARADGWIPLWTGIIESWTPQYEGARSSGYRADSFAEVRLIETLAWVARTDDNTTGSVGAGEAIVARVDRLLTAAEWPFGTTSLFNPGAPLGFTLQATTMSANRLAELYLTADSSGGIVRSDVTGSCLVTNKDAVDLAARLAEFTYLDLGGGVHLPAIVLSGDVDGINGALWHLGYDPDSIQTVNDPEGIVNDHRYTRVGGTQQIFEHDVSIGQFSRVTRARGDLICTADSTALAIAAADNDREARTALRIDNIDVVATGRPLALLAVAAADHNDQMWVFPPAAAGFTGSAIGHIRSLSHTVTPMKGRVHWTASYALDLYSFNNLPGAILPEA